MNIYQPITKRQERQLRGVQVTKRKFNLVKGLKSCFDDFNEWLGIETTGDKIFYHTCLGFMLTVLIWVITCYDSLVGM